jgi:N-acetylglucosamine-6-phosphate deacetylase
VPATCVPANVLGLRKGRLAAGYDADVVLLDSELKPALTLVKGEMAFDRDLRAPV